MHSNNLKVYDGSVTGMVVDDLSKSFLDDYQFSLRTKMQKCNLTYDRVRAFYYKLHKISINRGGGSYIITQDWIKYKKATINPINKNYNKCFQYAISVALNYQNIKKDPQRISKIKLFINIHHIKKIGILWRKTIDQLLLIFFMLFTILNRCCQYIYQNIIVIKKIKQIF